MKLDVRSLSVEVRSRCVVQWIAFMASLAEVLARETREGELYERLADGRLRCYACGHCCPLPTGAIGVCKVRFN